MTYPAASMRPMVVLPRRTPVALRVGQFPVTAAGSDMWIHTERD
jgi:hypothetical protein